MPSRVTAAPTSRNQILGHCSRIATAPGGAPSCLATLRVGSPDGVFVVDAQQRIVHWNDIVHTLLGYAPDEVLGRRCYEVLAGHDAAGRNVCQRLCREVRCAERGQSAPDRDVLVRARDGRRIWLHIVSLLLTLPCYDEPLIVHLCRDVTKEKHAVRIFDVLLGLLSEHIEHSEHVTAGPSRLSPVAGSVLTARERDVLAFLAEGHGTDTIAERLCVSRSTARKHIQSILTKFGVHSRVEALAYAARHRLLPYPDNATPVF